MTKAKGDNIVPAMKELAERRNAGEQVHVIVQEVADDFDIPVAFLRHRAETSWGIPLETDRERHAAHFDYVETKAQVEQESRQLARIIWEANRAYVQQHTWWHVDWNREIDQALAGAGIDHPGIEDVARAVFMDEVRRLGALKTTS